MWNKMKNLPNIHNVFHLYLSIPGKGKTKTVQFSSVAQSSPTLCDPMDCSTPGLPVYHQLPELTQTSCSLSWWCHPTILSSVVPFSSCLQSSPASGFFPISGFFLSHGQSIGVSASTSVLPVNIQGWFPLRWTGWISVQSKGILRVPNIDFIIFILQFYFLGTQFQSLFSLCTAHTYSSCLIHIHSHCQVHT